MIQINPCYRENEPIYPSLTAGYRKEYYILHRNIILDRNKEYYKTHKKRLQYLKKIWFQKNKERLRIKWGYKRRNITKPKDIINTEIIRKNIILTFD